MQVNDRVQFVHPSAGIMSGVVIDVDPQAELVSVDIPGEPFFRRIPWWLLKAI